MKATQLVFNVLFFSVLAAAGPLRRVARADVPRLAPFSNQTITPSSNQLQSTSLNSFTSQAASSVLDTDTPSSQITTTSETIAPAETTSLATTQRSRTSSNSSTTILSVSSTSASAASVTGFHGGLEDSSATTNIAGGSGSSTADSQDVPDSSLSPTRTFPPQQFTAVNTLTGFDEIQPAPTPIPSNTLNTPLPTAELTSTRDAFPTEDETSQSSTSTTASFTREPFPTVQAPTSGIGSSTASRVESSSSETIPRFSLTNTGIIPLPTELLTVTFTPSYTDNPSSDILSPSSSEISTTTTPLPSGIISTITIDLETITGTKKIPVETPTITKIPTVIESPTPTSITPAQYSSNLAEALGYNKLFAGISATTPCKSGEIACISGSIGNCGNTGTFALDECSTGEACFAMPMNNTRGVFVGCTNKASASQILGLGSSPTSPTPSSATSPAEDRPTPVPSETTIIKSSFITITKTTTQPPLTTYITTTTTDETVQTPEPAPSPTPDEPVETPSFSTTPPGTTTFSTPGSLITIIPVPDENGVLEKLFGKETVTVTVTKIERG
ncbi:hypothetical protein B0O99DRAFT_192053 [Bisporella sp. PMI_857]|nr:hypothetical protein B0O99DRAFT_192053 [Bisporella sp. PMI_857]